MNMKNILTIITLIGLIGCDLIPAVAPDDFVPWHSNPIQQDTIPTDSIVIPPDTCTEFIEITTPAFVTLYMKFDTPQDSVLWEGGGIQSYSLAEIVAHISSLSAQVDTAPIGGSVLLKGTNNHTQYQLKIFAKVDGAKWYMGTATQALILPGSNAAYYKDMMQQYPSYDQFSFFGSDITCEEGIGLCREVLKDCHKGRWYADLYFLPCQPPQSVRDSLDLYGWERIRALRKPYIIDLRGKKGYNLEELAATGAQIIVKE